MQKFFWIPSEVPPAFHTMLLTQAKQFPGRLAPESGDTKLVFRKTDSLSLTVTPGCGETVIEAGTVPFAARGLGCAMSGLAVKETTDFTLLGIMLDCSRNKVFSIDFLKHYLAQISLMGCNMVMLYTEDTFAVEGEPLFGFMRGPFTGAEIRELDDYADTLGIELIPCLETLGHMEQILKLDVYADLRDQGGVLLVDEPKTYALLEKMIHFWKQNLRTNRIHIGMDETHGLGRGKFQNLHGVENPFAIFNRHLAKLCAICEKEGLRPIIWSDQYFRIGSKHNDYYDLESCIPEDVRAKIPRSIQMCYWDYYHADAEFYEKFIELHRSMGFDPIVGSGVWTWNRFWYDHTKTRATVVPCLQAARKCGLKELFFTMWGDNGGFCSYESALAGLEFATSLAFGNSPDDTEFCAKRFQTLTGHNYQAYLDASDVHLYKNRERAEGDIPAYGLLVDDPLMGTIFSSQNPESLLQYEKIIDSRIAELSAFPDDEPLCFIVSVMKFISAKLKYRRAFLAAWNAKDRAALARIASHTLPALCALLEDYAEYLRADWMSSAKPFGFETIQIWNGGQLARLHETARRIQEYLDGKITTIAELDALEAAVATGHVSQLFRTGSCIC